MKRLILLVSILLLVGGAGLALGDCPSPEPQLPQPSATTPTTTTDSAGQPPRFPWKPPRVLEPGDLVRLGNTAEVCGVIQTPTYKTIQSVQPMKKPIIGVFCWATTSKGTPVPNGHINWFSAWGKSTVGGFAQWQGTKKIVNQEFPPPLGIWPRFTGDDQPTDAQKRGRIVAIIVDGHGYVFRVQGAPIYCGYGHGDNGRASVSCSGGAGSYYDITFREPWTACDAVVFHNSTRAYPDFSEMKPSWGSCPNP